MHNAIYNLMYNVAPAGGVLILYRVFLRLVKHKKVKTFFILFLPFRLKCPSIVS